MTNSQEEATWKQEKAKLKQKFLTLTDSDLDYIKDKKDEMLGRIQTKLGKSKEELQRIMQSL